MASQLSEHLWNAAMLLVAALVALAADRIATSSPRQTTPGSLDVGALGEIATFITAVRGDSAPPRFQPSLSSDPLDARATVEPLPDVASQSRIPTVRVSQPNRLTAVLVADDRRVAVIDDSMVGVGDVLRDGARVAAIQRDRVFVIEKNGRWRTLTLTNLEPGGAR